MVIGILLTATGFAADVLGEYIGPIEFKGYLVFEYPEGENPITNIVFTAPPSLADSLIIVDVPSPWSHSYGGGTLTLSGGSLGPGGTVSVTVSLNKYHEEGEYTVTSVGTTSNGEVSQASGPFIVSNLILLNLLGLASAFRFPLAAVVVGLTFVELLLNRRSGPPSVATVTSTKPVDCQELVDKCKKAREAAEAAEAEAKQAKQKADSANLDHEKAEKAAQEAQKKLDEALKEPTDESEAWVEMDGRRITSMDLRLRSDASRALWDQYRNGEIDAKSLEEAWEELGEHSALEELRKKNREAKKEAAENALEKAKEHAKETEEREKEARKEAASAEKRAAEARAYADKVCKEADDCVKAQPKKPTSEDVPSGGTVTGPGGPSVVDDGTKAERICEEGATQLRPAGSPDRINVDVDFSIFIETDNMRKDEEAEVMAFDLARLAQDLDLAGSLLGGASSGDSIAGGIGAMKPGTYVTGAGGLIEGTATGIMTSAGASVGSGDMQISIPTSPPEVISEVLETTAKFGKIVAKKLGGWLKMHEIYRVRVRFFTQRITATPYEIWECRNNQWVCREKIYEFTIGNLRLGGQPNPKSFRLESDIARHRFNQEIKTVTQMARNRLRKGARQRLKFEQDHRPGPCGS